MDVSLGLMRITESAVAITAIGVSILGVMVLIAAFSWIKKSVQGNDDWSQCSACDNIYPADEFDEHDRCGYCAAYSDSHHGGESDDSIPCAGCAYLFPESDLDECHYCASCADYSVTYCQHCKQELDVEESAWSECPYCGHDKDSES